MDWGDSRSRKERDRNRMLSLFDMKSGLWNTENEIIKNMSLKAISSAIFFLILAIITLSHPLEMRANNTSVSGKITVSKTVPNGSTFDIKFTAEVSQTTYDMTDTGNLSTSSLETNFQTDTKSIPGVSTKRGIPYEIKIKKPDSTVIGYIYGVTEVTLGATTSNINLTVSIPALEYCGDTVKQSFETCDNKLEYTSNSRNWAPNQSGGYNQVASCTGKIVDSILKCNSSCNGYVPNTSSTDTWKGRCIDTCGSASNCSGALPDSKTCNDIKTGYCNASCEFVQSATCAADPNTKPTEGPAVLSPKPLGATDTPTPSPTPKPPGASTITAMQIYCHPFIAGRKQFDLTYTKVDDATHYLVTFGGHAFETGNYFTGTATTRTITGQLDPATYPDGPPYLAVVTTYNAANGQNSVSIPRNVGGSCGVEAAPTAKPGDPTFTPSPTLKAGIPTYTPTPTTQPAVLGCPDVPQDGYRNKCQATACVAPARQFSGANSNEACKETNGLAFCCMYNDTAPATWPKACPGGTNAECTGFGSFCNTATKQCSTECKDIPGYYDMRCGDLGTAQSGEQIYGSTTHNDCRTSEASTKVCYYKPIEDNSSNPTNTPTPTKTSNQSGATNTPTPTMTQTGAANTPTPTSSATSTTNPNAASCTGANAGKNNCPCNGPADCTLSDNNRCNIGPNNSKGYSFCW